MVFSLFYNQKELRNGFWHSSKGRLTPFIHRCFVVWTSCGFSHHGTSVLLQRLKIIRYHSQFLQWRISTSSCFSQIHSILWKLCEDPRCWHTSWRASGFMTSRSNPFSSSVPSWLMPKSTSWCTFPWVDTRQLRSTALHLYNSKGLRGVLQCWKTHYVYFCQLLGSLGRGGPGSHWETLHKMKPLDWREDKQTRQLARRPASTHTLTQIEISTCADPHTRRPHKYTASRKKHTSTPTGMNTNSASGKVNCSAGNKEHNDNKRNYCWLYSFPPAQSIYADTADLKLIQTEWDSEGLANKSKWWVSLLKQRIIRQSTQ